MEGIWTKWSFLQHLECKISTCWISFGCGWDNKSTHIQSLFQNKRKEKLLAFNFDSLWKRGGRKKAIIAIRNGCQIEKFYMNKKFVHAKNEHLYTIVRNDNITNCQVFHGVIISKKKKFIQSYVCFHLKVNI
jgi:hypothetical protein